MPGTRQRATSLVLCPYPAHIQPISGTHPACIWHVSGPYSALIQPLFSPWSFKPRQARRLNQPCSAAYFCKTKRSHHGIHCAFHLSKRSRTMGAIARLVRFSCVTHGFKKFAQRDATGQPSTRSKKSTSKDTSRCTDNAPPPAPDCQTVDQLPGPPAPARRCHDGSCASPATRAAGI